MKLLAEWIVRAFVLLAATYFVPGFKIDSYLTALVVALVLGILNVLIKPLLVIFTLPATILTLGLFMFVINAILLLIAAHFVEGFHISSFGTAILAAVVISIIGSILNVIFK